jgi:hypothetical protein
MVGPAVECQACRQHRERTEPRHATVTDSPTSCCLQLVEGTTIRTSSNGVDGLLGRLLRRCAGHHTFCCRNALRLGRPPSLHDAPVELEQESGQRGGDGKDWPGLVTSYRCQPAPWASGHCGSLCRHMCPLAKLNCFYARCLFVEILSAILTRLPQSMLDERSARTSLLRSRVG